ncbi:hypothetical protein ACTA71_008313 [Dictyostelium dimigraforme]
MNILIIIIILTIIVIYRNREKGNENVPGPKGIPILGNLISLKGDLHLKLQEYYKQYGTVFRIRMGSIETVVLTEYSTIKEAFIGNSEIFERRFQRESRFKLNNCESLLISNGDLHKKLKSVVLSELTALKIKNNGFTIINNEITKLFKELDKLADIGEPIYLSRYIKMYSMNVVLCFTYGERSSYQYNQYEIFQEYFQSLSNYIKECGQPILSDFIPFLKPFAKNVKLEKEYNTLINYANKLIDKYKNENLQSENVPIISNLLSSFEKGEISWKSVLGVCIDLQSAGTDTTANTIMFCLTELINSVTIQNNVYNEIKKINEKQKSIEDDNYGENLKNDIGEIPIHYSKCRTLLPYLSMVIKETFRKYPVATITPHQTSKDVEFKGFKISKGTHIIQNIWATHRNEKIYPSPDSFIPERFLEEKTNSNLVHFGCGVRDCVGKSLAESEIFTIIANLINRYEFINPNPSIPLNEIGTYGLTLACPDNKIIIKKRI